MAKATGWRRYLLKRTEVFGLHWFRQIAYPVIVIEGLVVIYSIIKPEAASVINISFWGGFFIISFGVFLFIFLLSFSSWGRKILYKMPWEVGYRRRDNEIKELKRRVGNIEKEIGIVIIGKEDGKIQSRAKAGNHHRKIESKHNIKQYQRSHNR